MEAAARARLDADYTILNIAAGRRREVVWTRTEAAAHARLETDYAILCIAPLQEAGSRMDSDGSCCSCSIGRGLRHPVYRPLAGGWKSCGLGRKLLLVLDWTRTTTILNIAASRRREVAWTRTEAAARARSDADYAILNIATGRRREVVWTLTEDGSRIGSHRSRSDSPPAAREVRRGSE